MTTPDEIGYLFILTYGRSGSTLLQGILNSIPGYVIRGENRQAMRHLYLFHETTRGERTRQRREQRRRDLPVGGSTPESAFFGIDNFPVQSSLRNIRRLATRTLLRPEDGTRVCGFKEIRWGHEDTGDFVEWLRAVFPGARFVLNTRNHADVAQSKFWTTKPDALEELREFEDRLLAVLDGLGPDGYRVHYDDYVRDPTTLHGLFEWLGEPFDEQRVAEVMALRHSY